MKKKKKKKWVHELFSEVKLVENSPKFEKLARVYQYGIQGF